MNDLDRSQPATLQARIDRLAQRRLGAIGPCTPVRTLTAGANKSTYAFDAPTADGPLPLILQCSAEGGGPQPGGDDEDWIPKLTGAEEFTVVRTAHQAGVPAPDVRHLLEPDDELGDGAVTVRLDGETIAPKILREPAYARARDVMAAQCGTILAAIHRLPAGRLPFLRAFDAEASLATYGRMLHRLEQPIPMLELALAWAAERRPRDARRTVVHGDFRLGNLIVDGDGVRAVLDWEIAHIGEPLEDLGYLCMRTWRFGGPAPVGGFGRREDLYAAYEAATGQAVDPAAVRFWEVLGAMRWAFGCVRRALAFRHQPGRALEFAGVGRRLEEPLYDILCLIEGNDS